VYIKTVYMPANSTHQGNNSPPPGLDANKKKNDVRQVSLH